MKGNPCDIGEQSRLGNQKRLPVGGNLWTFELNKQAPPIRQPSQMAYQCDCCGCWVNHLGVNLPLIRLCGECLKFKEEA